MKLLCLTALILALGISCSACTSQTAIAPGEGYYSLVADAEGLRAFNDGSIGLVEQGRSTPDQKTAYWQNRDQETQVRGLKFRRVAK